MMRTQYKCFVLSHSMRKTDGQNRNDHVFVDEADCFREDSTVSLSIIETTDKVCFGRDY
jgi:hypothetical protein